MPAEPRSRAILAQGDAVTMANDAVQASVKNDELINADLVRKWLASGLGWLLLFPTIGALVSTKFTYPEFLGDTAWLTFGRLRPIHVNGVIWGAFSTTFIGLCFYIVPRLTGVRLWGERWSYLLLWVWNINLAAAVAFLALGHNRGWDAGELPRINVLVILLGLALLTTQLLMTIRNRRQIELYVSLWYLIAAFVWTDVNLILLLLGPYHIPGINNAAWHGLYIHYVVGFWSLAFFYPFVGIHHYLYSPIADWAETIAIVSSMMLIIPVWTVLQNFFGTMIGRWPEVSGNLPAKFLIVGSLMYLVGCFQGSLEALRSLQQPTHFTDFVISHSHLTVFGTFVVWAIAGTMYVWPRLAVVRAAGGAGVPPAAARLWSFRVGNWGFWLITLGISTMGLVLVAQGLTQGFMLMAGVEWMHSVNAIRPYWWVRTLTGMSMDVGMSLVVYVLMRTTLAWPTAVSSGA